MPNLSVQLSLASEQDTRDAAARLAPLVKAGDVLALEGDLGAGKTVFARGFIEALGGDGEVPSPTFTLVQSYELSPVPVHHFDLYRLEQPEDAFELGIEELFPKGISLIEWPDRLGPYLPRDHLAVRLSHGKIAQGEGQRELEMVCCGNWEARDQALQELFS